ncbi:hypothetical protein B0H16DRAFT_1905393 [Mycena metata]|uniref:Uncharacterized protein n=1 Tax=Mycena metata TaxID=1033252 RepID=A0AAD7DF11_9AGAR|nr:hypothetical protein B0H16DRAFT_1905393 [Mycena metata]
MASVLPALIPPTTDEHPLTPVTPPATHTISLTQMLANVNDAQRQYIINNYHDIMVYVAFLASPSYPNPHWDTLADIQDVIGGYAEMEMAMGNGHSDQTNLLHTLADNAQTLVKVAKLDDGSFHLPADRNNGPRETPASRKTYHVSTAAFVGPSHGPNSLETTSALPFDYESSDDEPPLAHLDLTSPSKRPIRGNHRTRTYRSVSPPTLNDDMNVDDDVFGNGQPQAQQGFHFHTPPAVPPPQLPPPPPPPPPAPAPAAGGAQLFAAAAAVFNAVAVVAAVQTPPDLALLNHAVVGREHNGYHGDKP